MCDSVCVLLSAGDEWPGVWALVLPAVLELVSLCHDHVRGEGTGRQRELLKVVSVMIPLVFALQTISCPATSCDIVVDEATVLCVPTHADDYLVLADSPLSSYPTHTRRELLCDAEVKQKYQLLITNSFVQDHPHLKWCPSPGCPNAVLTTSTDHSPVTCSCGHTFW